jgi:hypothetical protein
MIELLAKAEKGGGLGVLLECCTTSAKSADWRADPRTLRYRQEGDGNHGVAMSTPHSVLDVRKSGVDGVVFNVASANTDSCLVQPADDADQHTTLRPGKFRDVTLVQN